MDLDERRYFNPLLFVSGTGSRVASTTAGRLRVYAYNLEREGSFAISGELEPSSAVCWGSGGVIEFRSGAAASTVAAGRPRIDLYRNALSCSSAEGASGLILLIPRRDLFRAGAQIPEWDWRAPSPERALAGELMAGLSRLMAQGAGPGQIERMAQLLLPVLADEVAGGPDAKPHDGETGDAPWYVTMTEQYLVERLSRPPGIQSLASGIGISPRTLHEGFRRHRGCSPMKFLRERRMEAVRQELMHPTSATSVTDVALKYGFNHLGRFSGYYERQFGELPSETLAHARPVRYRTMAATA